MTAAADAGHHRRRGDPTCPTAGEPGEVEDEAPAELDGSTGVADEGWRVGDRTRTGDVQLGNLDVH